MGIRPKTSFAIDLARCTLHQTRLPRGRGARDSLISKVLPIKGKRRGDSDAESRCLCRVLSPDTADAQIYTSKTELKRRWPKQNKRISSISLFDSEQLQMYARWKLKKGRNNGSLQIQIPKISIDFFYYSIQDVTFCNHLIFNFLGG